MIVADLHVHTKRSDGTLTLAAIPDAARRAALETVAVTDHDRFHPDLSGPIETRDGITIVHGIELRVETETQRLDLLGYGVDPTPELRRLTDDLQTNRIDRAGEIIERVENRLDVTLDVEPRPGIGRPHIATAIERSHAPYDYQAAFDELIGNDGPCFVPRDIPSFSAGRDCLGDACALVGLAHPFRYQSPEQALERARALDAIEISYPYDLPVDTSQALAVADRHDLVITGGSDAHDEQLGQAGLDRKEADAFRSALH